MGELENLKETIIREYGEKFAFFQTDGEPLTDLRLFRLLWAGDDYKHFLEIAEKSGSKIIYLSENMAAEEKYEEHGDDIAELQLGFLSNGILHVLPVYASWYDVEEDIAKEEKEAEDTETLLQKPVNELVESMTNYVDNESKELGEELNETIIDQLKRQYWMEHNVDVFSIEPKVKVKIKRVENLVDRHFLDIIRKDEDNKIEALLPEFVEWCKKQGITGKMYLKKTTLETFLDEKGITLSSIGIDKLYNKALIKLRST